MWTRWCAFVSLGKNFIQQLDMALAVCPALVYENQLNQLLLLLLYEVNEKTELQRG
jgi:hypothetical protein